MEIAIKTTSFCHKSSHTKLLPGYLNITKEMFTGVFFQSLCYQTEIEHINEIKVDSTGGFFFIGIEHFTFNVKTLFPYEFYFFQLSGIPFAGPFAIILSV